MTLESSSNDTNTTPLEPAVGVANSSKLIEPLRDQDGISNPVPPSRVSDESFPGGKVRLNVLTLLRERFRRAIPEGVDPESFTRAIRESGSDKFGDYQANGCMAAAKTAGVNPRDLAAAVAQRVDLAPLADPPELAGPGFLNITLTTPFLAETLKHRLVSGRLLDDCPGTPQTIIVDFSSPNVAKPMHVGHLRSTVIGDALARIFEALGHKVWRDNHLGDWGAQFGMILWGYRHLRDPIAYAKNPVRELARLYRKVNDLSKPAEELGEKLDKVLKMLDEGRRDEAARLVLKLFDGRETPTPEEVAKLSKRIATRLRVLQEKVAHARAVTEATRRETAKLHAGDPENRRLWNEFMPHCLRALEAVYRRLDIRFDTQLGESFFDPMLADVVADLQAKGLAVESEGALAVFNEGANAPFLIRKRDGAYNYATTDLATIKHRVETYHPDRVLYVVDHRQSDHFKQLFTTARRWGYDTVDLVHVSFGTILGRDGRPYKTRAGDVVGLESLLDEAVAQARKVVEENSPDLKPAEKAKVARIVGLGAVKYADLSQNRTSDYKFDLDKMTAMNGNTATYLQYAYARNRSIFRKGGVDPAKFAKKAGSIELILNHPAERALAVKLVRYPEAVELAAAELKPNILTDYLFQLATTYSSFFEECPVLKAESDERRDSRLALCELTARTLKAGLGLLGIGTAERL